MNFITTRVWLIQGIPQTVRRLGESFAILLTRCHDDEAYAQPRLSPALSELQVGRACSSATFLIARILILTFLAGSQGCMRSVHVLGEGERAARGRGTPEQGMGQRYPCTLVIPRLLSEACCCSGKQPAFLRASASASVNRTLEHS